MMSNFSFAVLGEPIGQGSMKHIGNGRMIASNDKKLQPWRLAVVNAIQQRWLDTHEKTFFDQAIRVEMSFCVSRPKTVKREYPTTPYDLDKLVRAIGDALTVSGVISDDAIITDILAAKRYSDGCPFGVHVVISVIESLPNSLPSL
jgi:crossover junction endodeoxyribonuclease RusA